MKPLLTLAVLAAIVLEIVLLAQVGAALGVLPTVLLVIGTGMLGGVLMRREGRRTWDELRKAVQEQRTPDRGLIDTALVLLGGVLMVVPGFLSDLVGLLLILPFTRPPARGAASWMLRRRMAAAGTGVAGASLFPPATGGPATRGKAGPGADGNDAVVIQGEVVEERGTGSASGDTAEGAAGAEIDHRR